MMKKTGMLLGLALLGLVISGVQGCKEAEPTTPEVVIEKTSEALPPAVQAPKDHPAH